ncbi:DUF6314 family protein [Paracoccus shanxieyensis]|uniref:DUF6314 domain-containing protein n=1 Tax=Paracoccus shanxieyensis TaxID=2675752 RepID=A0A6L6IRD3_9RHOB|nr:DUF6314 family protein [Paracoccus shanxieyensis]MTH62713.1 hypothetical protein [Paracoccus shanxieyensis]MTH86203.1 hypothetical protein [Paracoccus shanxieyensis]
MELHELLARDWRFSRSASTGERFTGTARFAPAPDGTLHYHEEGRITFQNGASSMFFRDYVYRVQNDRLTAFFSDMRLFHAVTLSRRGDVWQGAGHHLCIADDYDTTYLIAPDRLRITHDVAGPKKAYRLETEYRPA